MQLQDNKFDPSILSNLCLCPNELLILQVNHAFHNFLKVSALNLQAVLRPGQLQLAGASEMLVGS